MNKTKLFLSSAMSLIDPTGMENLLTDALDSKKQQTEDEINLALTKAQTKRIRKNQRRLYDNYKHYTG